MPIEISKRYCVHCHVRAALADTTKCHSCGKNPKVRPPIQMMFVFGNNRCAVYQVGQRKISPAA